MSNVPELSARQAQVLNLVAQGLSDREIGEELHMSAKTASNHVTKIHRKLGVSSRLQAIVEGVSRGIIDWPEFNSSATEREELSERERQILQCAATGLSAKQVGRELGITKKTVYNHTVAILRKLGVDSTVNAVRAGVELGIIDVGSRDPSRELVLA
jgi:DNA-binding NarL/FixJ family response regulator